MATNAGRFNNITLEAASAVGQFELVTVTASGAAKAGAASTTVPVVGVAVNSVDPSASCIIVIVSSGINVLLPELVTAIVPNL